ncbi:LamG domain-containing protein [Bythopirellula polymerisocia]|uniref:FecR protein n=1 Tax=Bythopirellula polymerisocia TaxID=2528003 RepID=A0A5C6CPS2_9BACT|nr:LamG domain-containing protein [Bythopirellula polymerisocia]TWU26035.1 FecR protein [Bythopirellula polymerisocia]
MDQEDNKRLQALASRLCDGDIDAEQLQELSALLDQDQEAIREYLDFTSVHLHLGHKLGAIQSIESASNELTAGQPEKVGVAQITSNASSNNYISARAVMIITLAASVIVASVFLINRFQSQTTFIARIIQKIDCDWGDQRWGAPQTALLEVGREIKLDRGLMVLEFGNGAEVTLEAPIQFRVLAEDRGNLSFGKLTANVPERGRGFTIHIPSGEVIDLGTSFGLLVDEAGISETHVFQGRVLLRRDAVKQGQSPQEWELTADHAIRIPSATQDVEHLTANRSHFVDYSHFGTSDNAEEKSRLAVPGDADLVLWLDAGRRQQLDSKNGVISWGDICVGRNSSEDNAWQIDEVRRPHWIEDSLAGRPAVRFDGSTHLVTTPFQTGDEVTIICVFKPRSGEQISSLYGKLLTLNASPSLILETTRNNQLASILFLANPSSKKKRTVLLEGPLPDNDLPTVCALVYSHSANRAALYVNGDLVSESHAPSIPNVETTQIIGNSIQGVGGFIGDVGDLLVFNSALPANQATELSNSLMEKYGITASQREPRVLSGLIPEEQ